jgi:hypothetical protein
MATLTGSFVVNSTKVTDFEITFRLKNDTDTTIHVCKFETPLEDICNYNHIQIYNDSTNAEVEYNGIMAERVPPSVSNGDYVTLQPGASTEYKQSVPQFFFPLQTGVRYRITTGTKWQYKTHYSDAAQEADINANIEPCTVTLTQ